MKQMFAKIAVTGMIAIGALSAAVMPAAADTLSLGLYSGGIVDVQYRDNDRRYGDERDWGRRHHRPGYDRPNRGRCSPGLAADKARAMGLRRANVVDVTPRRVVVEGRRHGGFRTVVFANVRGCPVIR